MNLSHNLYKLFVDHAKWTISFLVLLVGIGWVAQSQLSVDAIPNIGQNQVIVFSKWQGRSPKDIEDQITYPLSIALLSVPGAENVRGKSLFGFSFVQITFKDNIDFYWARSRVSEQLTTVKSQLPEDAEVSLGPDATALGQIFYYTLVPSEPTHLTKLRSIQDYIVKYALQSVDGVSEVASVGGYERQYFVDVDPEKMRFHKIPLDLLKNSLKNSNHEVGAKTVEQSGMEFVIRGRGFLGSREQETTPLAIVQDLENTVVQTKTDTPILIKDLADVYQGNATRRGALDYNGSEAVGGIVVMRHGENPRTVIERVKKKIKQIEPSLDGIKIHAVYDRTQLIDETIATLSQALSHEILITILVVLLFLMHIKTSLIIAICLPTAVLCSFILMKVFGLDANIMSLAGIAIAIGNMVDMGIVIAENIYSKLSNQKNLSVSERNQLIKDALSEVAPALMTASMTTIVSFMPVFFLTGRDFKLFSPLAWTKTFALFSALIVSISLIPALSRYLLLEFNLKKRVSKFICFLTSVFGGLLAVVFAQIGQFGTIGLTVLVLIGILIGFWVGKISLKEKFISLEDNIVSKKITSFYLPLLNKALKYPVRIAVIPILMLMIGLYSWSTLKSDDWIALDEGSLFYMPTLLPSAGFSTALKVLQTQDALIKKIPEVKDVLGKIGRADSAIDPAPAAMIETYITLKPVKEWRSGKTIQDVWDEINSVATLPGVTPASFLQPIEGRVIMLQSGIKANMALRIYGDKLEGLAKASTDIAKFIKNIPEINKNTVNPDIVLGKPYGEFIVNRHSASRYGYNAEQVNQLIATAIGGQTVTHTIEGRERYPVQLRYLRDYRDKVEDLPKIPVVIKNGEVTTLGQLADFKTTWGPAAINSEDARLVAHVSFSPSGISGDLETIDIVMAAVRKAQERGEIVLDKGYEVEAVGSFQNQIEANRRLKILIPIVILINLFLIYWQFGSLVISLVVFSGIPVAFGGGMFLLKMLGLEINTAVWVGFIALFGISIDNGLIICTYIMQYLKGKSFEKKKDFYQAIIKASMRRVRPCIMTTTTTLIALLPVILSSGRGADVARAMALPIFGGMLFALSELIIVPTLFAMSSKYHVLRGIKIDD